MKLLIYSKADYETMWALDSIVKSGKALYVGLSNYDGETMQRAAEILNELHCPFIINQNRYSILDRTVEKNGILRSAIAAKKGMIIFSPLAQGLLTNRYLNGIPEYRISEMHRTSGQEHTQIRLRQGQKAVCSRFKEDLCST